MCEFCSGSHHEPSVTDKSKPESQPQSADNARLALSLEATAGNPLVGAGDNAGNPLVGNSDKSASIFQDLSDWWYGTKKAVSQTSTPQATLDTFGVKSRPVADGKEQEIYYTAETKDQVVMRAPADATADQLQAPLEKIVNDRIKAIESEYKVKFATPGETVEKERLQNPTTCRPERGEMIHAKLPTLPGLYGIAEGLKHSSPSQFAADGVTGAKIYILDRKYMPNIYGNKEVLGVYKQDKDRRPALYMTPAGMALPPTEADRLAVGAPRNLAWGITHELTHNSQKNNWPDYPTPETTAKFGWRTTSFVNKAGETLMQTDQLVGKKGELFMNGQDDCHSASTWYLTNDERQPLDENGKVVEKIKDAKQFTNEEIMDRAEVRPFTYYFMNPREMLSEALTAYRTGPDTRAKLLNSSPQLYKVTEEYDRGEIEKFYGKNADGLSNKVRLPDGTVVDRQESSLGSIADFEKNAKPVLSIEHK